MQIVTRPSMVSAEPREREYEITLGEAEIRYIEAVVDLKEAYDRQCGKPLNLKVGEKTRRRLLNFTGAELAFAKLFNVYMDFTRRFRWYDVLLPGGKTVDIKHTDQDSGRLLVRADERKKVPDLFVLMVGEFPTFEFRGAIPGNVLVRRENLRDLGHGPCYVAEQSRLSLDVNW